MNNFRIHIVYIVVVAFLVVLLGWSLNKDSGEPIVVEKHTTDTLKTVVRDTTYITKVITKVEKEPSDTVYIKVNGANPTPIPRQDYTFSEPYLFDFKVRGCEVEFLDAKVYPKTIYQTITNTIEKEITLRQWDCYLGGGFLHFNDAWIPNIALTVKSPENWLFSGNLGIYQKAPLVGATIQYKITHKKK